MTGPAPRSEPGATHAGSGPPSVFIECRQIPAARWSWDPGTLRSEAGIWEVTARETGNFSASRPRGAGAWLCKIAERMFMKNSLCKARGKGLACLKH